MLFRTYVQWGMNDRQWCGEIQQHIAPLLV